MSLQFYIIFLVYLNQIYFIPNFLSHSQFYNFFYTSIKQSHRTSSHFTIISELYRSKCFLSILGTLHNKYFTINYIDRIMSNFSLLTTHKIKRLGSQQQDVPTNTPKVWNQKQFSFSDQSKDMQLRETDATLCSNPKDERKIKSDDFQFIKFLGNGKFGAVYLARHIDTGFIFAMKVIKKANIQAESQQQTNKLINQLIRQIKIQIFLNHPNIIKLYSFFSDEYKFYLLLELAPENQLYQYMKDNSTFNEQSVSFLMRQILLGINYMHENHIIHRDIKPENIVIVHGIPKICDFGWSVYCPKQFRNTLCGTPLYLSPQILMGDSYNEKIDSWAIGTLAYELFTGQNPFKITKKSEMTKILTQQFKMDSGSVSIKDFIMSALQKQPEKRLPTKLMLNHPFIQKYSQIQTCQQLCKKMKLMKRKEKVKTR